MRRIVMVPAAALIMVLMIAVPASARPDPANPHGHPHAGGGSSGNAIWVSVGASGGAKRGYTQCNWQPVWPALSGPTETRSVPLFVDLIRSILGAPFGDGDPATVTLVPEEEAREAAGGTLDPGTVIVPILDDDDGYVISETEGIGFLQELLLRLRGTHDLGVLLPNPDGSVPIDDLTDEEKAGERYRGSPSYPLVQRGSDPLNGGNNLWWDPWFLAPEDQKAGCTSGVIYSPRLNNPIILLPDLQDFVSELLPPAQPILIPTDRREGWAYVQVPTNFGVAGASLASQSAHAEVEYIDAGGSSALWADIVAIPTHLMFDPGDGSEPVVCGLSQMRFVVDDPGDCSHVYLDSSNVETDGTFNARVSVLWVGLYTDSTGVSTVVDIVPTSAGFDIPVAEARAAVSDES